MNNFEQHIKDQMQNFAPTPPPSAWAGVESNLGSSTVVKAGGKLLLKWIAGVVITGSVINAAVLYNSNSNSNQQIIATTPTEQPANNILKDKEVESKIENNNTNSTSTNSGMNQFVVPQINRSQEEGPHVDFTPVPMEITGGNVGDNNNFISNSTTDPSNIQPKGNNVAAGSAPAKIYLSDYTLCPDQLLNVKLIANCQGCPIRWGDGETEEVDSRGTKHAYKKEGKYIISVAGLSETVTVKKTVLNIETILLNSKTVLYKISNPDNVDLKINYSDGSSEITNQKEVKHQLMEGELRAKFSTNNVCKVSSEVVTKSEVVQPLIPDAFTVDNDGINDTYEVDFNKEKLKLFQLMIADSKGQVVFTSFNQQAKWDGTYNGVQMPAGVYTIQLVYQYEQYTLKEPTVSKPIFLFRK